MIPPQRVEEHSANFASYLFSEVLSKNTPLGVYTVRVSASILKWL